MPEYSVRFTVRGEINTTIKADSLEDAKAKSGEMCDDEEFGLDLDTVDDVDFHIQELHPVVRDGVRLLTTYVREGDVRVE